MSSFLVILFFRQAGKQLSLCPDPFEVKFIQFSIERVWLTKSLTSRQHTLERSFQVQRDAEGKKLEKLPLMKRQIEDEKEKVNADERTKTDAIRTAFEIGCKGYSFALALC